MPYIPSDVNAWFQAVQFRDGPAAAVASFVSLLNSGSLTPAQVQNTIINDTFTTTNVNPIVRLYQAAFNRVPDQAGQNFWVDNIAAGTVTTQTAANQFANSPEFIATYGNVGGASQPINQAILTALYNNVLNRAPDQAGFNFWLNSGQNVGQVLNYFAQSQEFTLASNNATNLFQQAEIAGAAPDGVGALFQFGGYPGNTYTLTTSTDTISIQGSWGVVNGTGTTFTANDKISAVNGSGSVGNVLNIADTTGASAAGVPAGVTVSDIQTANVTSNGTIGRQASSGTAQVDTIALGSASSTAAVQQSNTYAFGSATTGGLTQTFTYGVSNGSFVTNATAATQASNFASSVNSVAGATVAFIGTTSNTNTASTASTTLVLGAANSAIKVGMAITGAGVPAGTTITAISGATLTLSQPATVLANASLTYGGGADGVTVLAPTAGTVSPAIAFGANTDNSVPTSSLTVPNGLAQVVNVSYGSATGSYVESGNLATDATALAAVLSSLAGPSASVAAAGTNVTITSATPGTALATVTVTAGANNTGSLPSVSVTTPNGSAPVSAAVYDVSGFTGLTQFNGSSTGGANINAASTTSITETESSLGTGVITINGGNNVTVNATGGTTGEIAVGATKAVAGNASVTSSQSIGDGVTGGTISVTAAKDVTVTSTTSGNSVNTTATLGTVVVNGGASTTTVTVKETTAVAASGTVAGVQNGTVLISDVNKGSASKVGTITTANVDGYNGIQFGGTSLSTLNLANGKNNVIIDNSGLTTPVTKTLALSLNNVSSGVLDDADIYTTLNVTTSGINSTLSNITFGAATALNIGGTSTLNLTSAAGLSALKTVVVTGSAGVTADFTGGTITSVDSSGSSGAVKVSVDATKATFKGGSGASTVTLGTAAPTKMVTAGTGTSDTLVISAANAAVASATSDFASFVSGFENLTLTSATNQTIDLAILGGYKFVSTSAGNGLTLNGFANAGTLELTAAGTAYTLANSAWAAGSADVANILLKNGSGAGVAYASAGITAANLETLNISVTDTQATPSGTYNDLLTLLGNSVKTINVSGNAGLTLTATDTALTKLDASGITLGGFTFTSGALASAAEINGSSTGTNTVVATAATKAVTYTGGTGDDIVTINNAQSNVVTLRGGANAFTGGDGNNTVTGGTDADTIVVGNGNNSVILGDGANTFTGGNGNNTVTGGVNVDTIVVGNGVNTINAGLGNDLVTVGSGLNIVTLGGGTDKVTLSTGSVNANTFTTVVDFTVGDQIKFTDVGTPAPSPLGSAVTLAPGATLSDYANAASAGNGSVNAIVKWFNFGGDTYVVNDISNAATFANGTDQIIKLTGVLDLSTSTVDANNLLSYV